MRFGWRPLAGQQLAGRGNAGQNRKARYATGRLRGNEIKLFSNLRSPFAGLFNARHRAEEKLRFISQSSKTGGRHRRSPIAPLSNVCGSF